jgi:hypothetical protein
VPDDAFGVRWTGTITTLAASGNYTFWVDADDGARLWIDELLVVDGWSAAGTASGVINLPGGSDHTLRLDYRELGGNASVQLRWAPPGGFPTTVPSSALRATTDLNGDGVSDLDTDDCNQNGIEDAEDIQAGTSEDLDLDGIPDECEGFLVFDVPGDFPTIAGALLVAEDGDVIRLADGVYTERFDPGDRNVSLIGNVGNPSSVTLLPPAGTTGPMLRLTGGQDDFLVITGVVSAGVVTFT